jgi:alanyl aminopeptidase
VALSQERYRAELPVKGARPDPLWKVPVCIEFGKGGRGRASRTCTLLSERSTSVELETRDCPEWVLPNAGYAGYYRFALPGALLGELESGLPKRDALHKIGYLTNLWALVRSGDVPATRMLDVLQVLRRERERDVVEQIIRNLNQISDALVDEASRAKFRLYVGELLLPIAKRLGWDPRAGDSEDDRLFRRTVLGALATLSDDEWVIGEAEKRARAFIAQPTGADADGTAIALKVAAQRGLADVGLDRLSASLARATLAQERVAIVQALGSLGKADELRRALNMVLAGTIRAQDAVYLARAASEWPQARNVLVAWLAENFGALYERFPGFGAAHMLAPLARLCDPEARKAAARAFEPLVAKIGSGSDKRLREALEQVDRCIDLRRRQAAPVATYLAKYSPG